MCNNLTLYNLRRHAEKIRNQIASWDHNDADTLRDLLIEFSETRDALESEGISIEDIDGSSLPSEQFPEGFDTSCYWALDKSGYAVVGVSWERHELSVEKISILKIVLQIWD